MTNSVRSLNALRKRDIKITCGKVRITKSVLVGVFWNYYNNTFNVPSTVFMTSLRVGFRIILSGVAMSMLTVW